MRNCAITGKETYRNIRNVPLAAEVILFVRWYSDKIKLEQRKKAKGIPLKKINMVSNGVCIEFMLEMKNKFGYDWRGIQEKLSDELMLKGLISDEEHREFNKTIL